MYNEYRTSSGDLCGYLTCVNRFLVEVSEPFGKLSYTCLLKATLTRHRSQFAVLCFNSNQDFLRRPRSPSSVLRQVRGSPLVGNLGNVNSSAWSS